MANKSVRYYYELIVLTTKFSNLLVTHYPSFNSFDGQHNSIKHKFIQKCHLFYYYNDEARIGLFFPSHTVSNMSDNEVSALCSLSVETYNQFHYYFPFQTSFSSGVSCTAAATAWSEPSAPSTSSSRCGPTRRSCSANGTPGHRRLDAASKSR